MPNLKQPELLKRRLIDTLHSGGYSCVIAHGDVIRTFDKPGVADLLHLLHSDPLLLHGATVADKVVGKAAAALLIVGKIKYLYAALISQPAVDLLSVNGVETEWQRVVPSIKNRSGSDICPMEKLALTEEEPEKICALITDFVNEQKNRHAAPSP
jgi:iron complex outermembrane receptor protein/vitamin B12 transporter